MEIQRDEVRKLLLEEEFVGIEASGATKKQVGYARDMLHSCLGSANETNLVDELCQLFERWKSISNEFPGLDIEQSDVNEAIFGFFSKLESRVKSPLEEFDIGLYYALSCKLQTRSFQCFDSSDSLVSLVELIKKSRDRFQLGNIVSFRGCPQVSGYSFGRDLSLYFESQGDAKFDANLDKITSEQGVSKIDRQMLMNEICRIWELVRSDTVVVIKNWSAIYMYKKDAYDSDPRGVIERYPRFLFFPARI